MNDLSLTQQKIFKAIFVVAFYCMCIGGHAQVENHVFVPVAPAELSSTFVRCIYKDSRGFMWFGTSTGLVRYDGTTIHRYEHADGNKNTLTHNSINAIVEDSDDNLWIGTAQGLVLYHRDQDNFQDVDSIPNNTNHLNSRYISALGRDRSGRIWIGTLGLGVNVYDPKTFTFTSLGEVVPPNQIFPGNHITSLAIVGDSIWAGTKGGLKLFDAKGMRTLPLPVLADQNITAQEITMVIPDSMGNIWLATGGRAIIKLTPGHDRYQGRTVVVNRGAFADEASNILTLSPDARGNLWMGGENAGLNYLNTTSEKVLRYESEEGDPKKLPTNSIRSVYVDDMGITWIGTYNRGVYMIDSKAKKFQSYNRNVFVKAGIYGENIKSIAEDKDGNIWLACDEGGLGVLDPRTNRLHYPELINKKLKTRHLTAVMFDAAGDLWIGTWGKGVYHVNLRSGAVKNYALKSKGFGDNRVSYLYQDSRKMLWAGSVGSGLFYFDQISTGFVGFNEGKRSGETQVSSYVTSIQEDVDSALWIGTLFGLYRFHFSGGDVSDVTLFMKDGKAGSIDSYDIYTVHKDVKGNLCFGSGDKGLAILPYGDSIYKSVTKEHGLISNTIRGILTDDSGNIWSSTNKGLSKYDPRSNTFMHYVREDGLPSNEFNSNAALRASDGKFYFGSIHGLVVFHPDSIGTNTVPPVVYLTDLKLNNQSVQVNAEGSPLQKHISLSSSIRLSYSQRSFAIDFGAISYGRSAGIQYCYMLEGFDKEWNCTELTKRATYTNLDAGDYVFLVKALNSDGVASKIPARLEITIDQAPWKTWWAYLLYVIIVSAAVYIFVQIRIERIKFRNQLELERVARDKEHALSELKTQFFTNISHEFRTPLSLIGMPMESLMTMEDLPPKVKERLTTIRASADKMMRLVNELMDFNKLEGAKLKLRVQHGELVQFITEIVSVFHDLAAKRNIHFGIHSMVRSLDGWFDHDKLEKILVNLLSNAFKFTADGGQINVIINSKLSGVGDEQNKMKYLDVVIVDNGIGIPAEEIPFIFDKFYQASSSLQSANPGTGIGLSLTKGLVELHHGKISVESTPHAETKFLIELPIEREAYSEDDICEISGYVASPGVAVPAIQSGGSPAADDDPDKAIILIIEDNDELRKYLSMELQVQFTVLEAKDGVEGYDIAVERGPDLIISDVLMPFKTGVELCREIKSNIKTSHIPFILLTAKSMVDDQITGISAGADVYITKPFSIRFLMTHVNQIIDSRQKLYSRFSQDVYLLPGKVASNEIDQAFLQKAIDYIVENIQDPQLGVDSIAGLFNLSRMQVYRKLKALTGKSVVEFIRMVRVKQALKLMDTHKYTLSEIAYQTGFNSSSYFTRVFKDEFGKTPSEYLEQA